MILSYKPTLMGGGVLNDVGHGFMEVARGIVGLASSVRGDTAPVEVQGASPINYSNALIYGSLAALGIYLVVKK